MGFHQTSILYLQHGRHVALMSLQTICEYVMYVALMYHSVAQEIIQGERERAARRRTTSTPQLVQMYVYLYAYIVAIGVMLQLLVGYIDECLRRHYASHTYTTYTLQHNRKEIHILYEYKGNKYIISTAGPDIHETSMQCEQRLLLSQAQVEQRINGEHVSFDDTQKLKRLLGPLEDWHQRLFTPKEFGWDRVTFTLKSGKCMTFERDEVLWPLRNIESSSSDNPKCD